MDLEEKTNGCEPLEEQIADTGQLGQTNENGEVSEEAVCRHIGSDLEITYNVVNCTKGMLYTRTDGSDTVSLSETINRCELSVDSGVLEAMEASSEIDTRANLVESSNPILESRESKRTETILNTEVIDNEAVIPSIAYPVESNGTVLETSEPQEINSRSASETDDAVMQIESSPYQPPEYGFANVNRIAESWSEFNNKSTAGGCYLKGCKWAPDGTCLMTNSEDATLRLFDLPLKLHGLTSWPQDGLELPELQPALRIRHTKLIYDYAWYPLMSSWEPATCCVVSCSVGAPVQLWDAFTGALRATYRPYDYADEVMSAKSITFDPSGENLFCGFNKMVKIFKTAIPGRVCITRNIKALSDQRGIVSCIAVNPALPKVYAVGTYNKTIGLYSEDGDSKGGGLCLLSGHCNGVTQLQFSADGTVLYSGARKDSELLAWDLRYPGTLLYTLRRNVTTNQRITFDITPDGSHLVSGNTTGLVTMWDLHATPVERGGEPELEPVSQLQAHRDCTNGVSLHRHLPILATSSGQRHFPELASDSSGDEEQLFSIQHMVERRENALKLWWAGRVGGDALLS